MKMNKLYFCVALLFAMVFSSCGGQEDIDIPAYGRWSIDNKTPQTFEVFLDFMAKDENDVSYVAQTSHASVQANTKSHISVRREENQADGLGYYQSWASVQLYSMEKFMIVTFEFTNGVRHIFTGKFIDCDVRDSINWEVSTSLEVDLPKCWDHVYTFTQEDYDEIMALYE